MFSSKSMRANESKVLMSTVENNSFKAPLMFKNENRRFLHAVQTAQCVVSKYEETRKKKSIDAHK